jgi:hypothetical protein
MTRAEFFKENDSLFDAFTELINKYPNVFDITKAEDDTWALSYDVDLLEQCLADQKGGKN